LGGFLLNRKKVKVIRLFLLSAREWLRQYIQQDGLYFSFAYIWELYAESAAQQSVHPTVATVAPLEVESTTRNSG